MIRWPGRSAVIAAAIDHHELAGAANLAAVVAEDQVARPREVRGPGRRSGRHHRRLEALEIIPLADAVAAVGDGGDRHVGLRLDDAEHARGVDADRRLLPATGAVKLSATTRRTKNSSPVRTPCAVPPLTIDRVPGTEQLLGGLPARGDRERDDRLGGRRRGRAGDVAGEPGERGRDRTLRLGLTVGPRQQERERDGGTQLKTHRNPLLSSCPSRHESRSPASGPAAGTRFSRIP